MSNLMCCVRVEWEGPFSVDDVIAELNNKDDYGLYQIYGKHIIFGEIPCSTLE